MVDLHYKALSPQQLQLLPSDPSAPVTTLMWTDDSLSIHNPIPQVEKALQYTWKQMTRDESRHENVSERSTRVIFRVDNGVMVTWQGMLDRVIRCLDKAGRDYRLVDGRLPFPLPQLDLMKGFRLNQEYHVREFLNKNRSGGFEAPTRWGKSTVILNILRAYPSIPILVVAPGVDLIDQSAEALTAALPDREIRVIAGNRKHVPCLDINVCSVDSLHRIDPSMVRLMVFDEPHTIGTDSRSADIARFIYARKLGVGATWTGRFDGSDKVVEGLIGPVLTKITYKQAVADKSICPLRVYVIKIPFQAFSNRQRQSAYTRMLWQNDFMGWLSMEIAKLIPEEWQTLFFIDNEKELNFYSKWLPEAEHAMDKVLTSTQRKDLFTRMRSGEVKRCLASSIYSQGVTFSDLRCMVNLCGGGGSITGVQKPGRLAEIRPGKARGYIIDFEFIPTERASATEQEKDSNEAGGWQWVVKDCRARRKVYQSTGYEIVDVPLVKNGDAWGIDKSKLILQ